MLAVNNQTFDLLLCAQKRREVESNRHQLACHSITFAIEKQQHEREYQNQEAAEVPVRASTSAPAAFDC